MAITVTEIIATVTIMVAQINVTDDERDTTCSSGSSWFNAGVLFIFAVELEYQCDIVAGAGYGGVDSETIRYLMRKFHFQIKIHWTIK